MGNCCYDVTKGFIFTILFISYWLSWTAINSYVSRVIRYDNWTFSCDLFYWRYGPLIIFGWFAYYSLFAMSFLFLLLFPIGWLDFWLCVLYFDYCFILFDCSDSFGFIVYWYGLLIWICCFVLLCFIFALFDRIVFCGSSSLAHSYVFDGAAYGLRWYVTWWNKSFFFGGGVCERVNIVFRVEISWNLRKSVDS